MKVSLALILAALCANLVVPTAEASWRPRAGAARREPTAVDKRARNTEKVRRLLRAPMHQREASLVRLRAAEARLDRARQARRALPVAGQPGRRAGALAQVAFERGAVAAAWGPYLKSTFVTGAALLAAQWYAPRARFPGDVDVPSVVAEIRDDWSAAHPTPRLPAPAAR